MINLHRCPKCDSEYTYKDANNCICSMCDYEWTEVVEVKQDHHDLIFKDAHGNILQDGDTVVVIKDLKIKNSSQVVKVGTKIKNIRLVEGDHNIDCKIEGVGPMKLKSEFVKKA